MKNYALNSDHYLAPRPNTRRRWGDSRLQLAATAATAAIMERYPEGLVIDDATRHLVRTAALSPDLPVAIQGETGTGKELLAKLIHSERQKSLGPLPLIPVNCAMLDSELSASLLFGHEKGAFSGAYRKTLGFVGQADGGILFLDEIQSLSLECQRKLLRVLNDGSYTPVGETRERCVQLQTIVSSTVSLEQLVRDRRLLIDLRMRLFGIEIFLKPLSERREDLNALVELFFAQQGIELGSDTEAEIVRRCSILSWPGNIRQLYRSLTTMLALARANNDLPHASYLPTGQFF